MDMRGKKKGLYQYINSEGKTGVNMGLLLNGEGDVVTYDTEKAMGLNAFFPSVLSSKTTLQESRLLRPDSKSGARKTYRWWGRPG